jgi:hypothetical protein
MSDKLRIEEWKGLYTNADEGSLNPSYQREAFNVRFKTGYMESEGYSRSSLNIASNVVYWSPVRFDADRYGNKIVDDKLIRDYTQSFEDYNLAIVKVGVDLQVHLYSLMGVYLSTLGIIVGENLEFYSIWNDKGIVLVFTSAGVYWCGKIKRTMRQDVNQVYDGFAFYKLVKNEFDASVGNIELVTDQGDEKFPVVISLNTIGPPYQNNQDIDWRIEYLVDVKFKDGNLQDQYRFLGRSPSKNEPFFIDPDQYDWFKFDEQVDPTPDPRRNSITIDDILNIRKPIGIRVFREEDIFIFKKAEFIITYISNVRDEYVISHFDFTLKNPGILKLSNFRFEGVQAIGGIPSDLSITNIVLYMRGDEKDDFQQIHSWDLNLGEIIPELFDILYLDNRSFNGIYATQTIGTLYKESEYKLIDVLTNYIEINGIAFGINGGRIYFPAVGSGEIMNGVFLDYIPEAEGEFLADVNGDLGVFSGSLDVISIQDSGEGYLLFSFKDSLNFDIRDQYDLGTSPEGIIIHTPRGIYVTNGYERKLISEPINDIVEKNYETGNIFYDDVNDMLFYLYYTLGKGGRDEKIYHSYRYDFAYPQWVEIVPALSGIMSFGYDGEIYLTIDEQVSKVTKTNNVESYIQTPKVNLDFPDIAKNIMYLIIDFEGRLIFYLEDPVGETIQYDITHQERRTVKFGVPVGMRTPSVHLGTAFRFYGKVYSVEIYYDILGEFRNEDFIPSPEAYGKGTPDYPRLAEDIKRQAEASAQR